MKIAKATAVAAFLFGLIAVARIRSATAGSIPSAHPDETIFVTNGYDVTAYPTGSRGDVAPIALTTDMTYPNGIAVDASGRIYAANFDTNTVTVYAASANGNVPPIAVIGGANTRLANPTAIALDASGKIYVLNSARYSKGSITVYPPLATSTGILNEAPIAAIAGSKTLLDNPTGIALDSRGEIYVTNELRFTAKLDEDFHRGRITVYPAGSDGNIAPIATISGAATGLALPIGIALDSSGNIYVGNSYTANASSSLEYAPSITVYAVGSKGNAPPIAIIAGANTALSYPQGIALDSAGNLYARGYVGNGYSLNVYPAGSNGNVSPAASIAGPDTGLAGVNGIALDSGGSIYVLNSYGGAAQLGSVTVYPAGSSGDAVPTATITSNFTRLPFASGIAVDSPGNIYVTNTLSGAGEDFSIEIYPAGGFATGPPIATIGGDSTGLYYPFAIAVDLSGNIYALNGDNAITVYLAGSVGNVMPNATLNVDTNGKSSPTGVAVDRRGNLYVANQAGENCDKLSCFQTGSDSVAVYRAGSDGDAKPSAVIAVANTNLASPSAIAVGHGGEIYVTNQGPVRCTRGPGYAECSPTGPGSITAYAPGSKGDAVPIATISGPHTGLRFPYEIALDSKGNIYVLNGQPQGIVQIQVGTVIDDERTAIKSVGIPGFFLILTATVPDILIFAAGSNGDVAPIGAIGGPFTGLGYPEGIAIGPGGP